jgi:hypothetical protein
VSLLPEEDVKYLHAFFMPISGINDYLFREMQVNNNVYTHLITVTKIIIDSIKIYEIVLLIFFIFYDLTNKSHVNIL